ncbi:MAG: hypothetical protein ACRD3N_02945 [Terracidiphilus sp.]
MKRTFLLWIAAAAAAALLPFGAQCQVAPEPPAGPPAAPAPTLKYGVFVGYSYSSLNQVNQSRYGLQGFQVAIDRDFGKHFGMTAIGDEYKWATSQGNPGKPVVESVLLGPQFRVNLYGPVDAVFRGLMGGEHTGGESETPKISFSGGFGGGIQASLSKRLALRIVGDRIGASFSLANNSAENAYSPHRTWNSRGTIGVVYRF